MGSFYHYPGIIATALPNSAQNALAGQNFNVPQCNVPIKARFMC
jgi:hypothetical protein